MAQFRAVICSKGGQTSRLGNKKGGISVFCNGWNIGITVHLRYDQKTGKDYAEVYKTGGSNGDADQIDKIAEITEDTIWTYNGGIDKN